MTKRAVSSIPVISGAIALVTVSILYYVLSSGAIASAHGAPKLQPYFSYSPAELEAISSLSSDQVMTEAEANHWVNVAFDMMKDNKAGLDASWVYAYLFTAQQDAAALSYQTKKKLAGNLTAVSQKTLCLLIPDKCASLPPAKDADAYSVKVAEIVTQKIQERLREEKKHLNDAPFSAPPSEWRQDAVYFGINFGSAMPWLLNSGKQFRLKAPEAYGAEAIRLQKEELEQIALSLTKGQLEAAKKWAAGAGTSSPAAYWIENANQYMEKRQTPLKDALVIRSVLARGIADATIAYFDTKYTYWKQRPIMLFPTLKTHLKTPYHPSYPSGHATIATTAALIMDRYFPENQSFWNQKAGQIGESRLWGGVHFPVDTYDGAELGRKIGRWVVEKMKER